MKALIAGLVLALSLSAQANEKVCLNNLTLDVQGQVVSINVNAKSIVKASVDNTEANAYLESYGYVDGLTRVAVELTRDQVPNLTDEQITSYDSRLDHHSILTLRVVLGADNRSVKEVEYDRHQDIDYGYDAESTLLDFSVLNVKACK